MWPYFFIALTVLFWGTASIFDKIALKEANPMAGIVIRSIMVFASLVLLNFFIKDLFAVSFKLSSKTILFFCLSGLFAGLLGMFTYYTALRSLPVSVVVPLCSVYPLIAALLGMLILHEGFNLAKLAGVIFIILGVWLVK